jgi:4-hydroxybenzoate polyprenyltransferase
MRLERPVGWWLLLLPGWWAIVLAQVAGGGGMPDLGLMALFLAGAIVMRGAGCVYNDIVDRDIDARVTRTRSRPLPSGQVSVRQAWAFLVALALVGLVILLQLNATAIWLGIASLGLVLVYPHMKRYTYWPQVFLGLAFNWGALLGWAAVRGKVEAPALALYGAGVFWTLAYDTIYAHQDREDDLIAGVKSTALRLGRQTPVWLAAFFTLSMGLLALAGWLAGAGWPWYLGVAAAMLHAIWQLSRLDIDDPGRCLRLFRANRDLGLLVLAGGLADTLLRALALS